MVWRSTWASKSMRWLQASGLQGQGKRSISRIQEDQWLYTRATLCPLIWKYSHFPSHWSNLISTDDIHRSQTSKAQSIVHKHGDGTFGTTQRILGTVEEVQVVYRKYSNYRKIHLRNVKNTDLSVSNSRRSAARV